MNVCKVVFLDRDGTINVDRGYVHRIEDWEFTDRATDAITLLRVAGFCIAVVTNQSGVAAGMYSMSDVDMVHAYMHKQVAVAGTRIDAVAVCPHAPSNGCNCRKPRTGMAHLIAEQLSAAIDYQSSWTIGDKPSDIGFGLAIGTNTALIRSRYWTEDDPSVKPTLIVDCLYDAAMLIVDAGGRGR